MPWSGIVSTQLCVVVFFAFLSLPSLVFSPPFSCRVETNDTCDRLYHQDVPYLRHGTKERRVSLPPAKTGVMKRRVSLSTGPLRRSGQLSYKPSKHQQPQAKNKGLFYYSGSWAECGLREDVRPAAG